MGRCVHEADEKWGGESKGADEKWGGESKGADEKWGGESKGADEKWGGESVTRFSLESRVDPPQFCCLARPRV